MKLNREPQNAASKTAKAVKPKPGERKMNNQAVAVISQFRKAPKWMKVIKTTFNGSSFTHIGVDTRKGVVAK